jgi:hypothetical protein
MTLRYRLAFYLFGLMIGIILVYYFMTKKAEASGVEFCYLPNCRVLKELRSKPLKIGDEAAKKLDEKWVTLEDIKKSMQYGDVDFSNSKTKAESGKLYIIEGKNAANEDIIIEMINYQERVTLKDIKRK